MLSITATAFSRVKFSSMRFLAASAYFLRSWSFSAKVSMASAKALMSFRGTTMPVSLSTDTQFTPEPFSSQLTEAQRQYMASARAIPKASALVFEGKAKMSAA